MAKKFKFRWQKDFLAGRPIRVSVSVPTQDVPDTEIHMMLWHNVYDVLKPVLKKGKCHYIVLEHRFERLAKGGAVDVTVLHTKVMWDKGE